MRRVFALTRLLYLVLAGFSLYLLLISRAGEMRAVWDFMSPLFAPTFFVTTLLLVVIVFSSETIGFKLFFIIAHSIISRSFSAIIFPAGTVGPQQSILGITRLVYENVIFHGWRVGSSGDILLRLFALFNKPNFQSVYSVMFSRMFFVDVFWVHLVLIPVLWGIFVPTLAFLIAKALGMGERVSVFSGLLVSGFPLLVYWGTISVPNSLGFIFFLGSLYFLLKYLSLNTRKKSKIPYLMVLFSFASFLSHFLTGIMSLAFLLFAIILKMYRKERVEAPFSAKIQLLVTFIFSTSLVPLALVYIGIFYPSHAYFSLEKIQNLSTINSIGLLLIGQYVYYAHVSLAIHFVGPLLGFAGMLYALYIGARKKSHNTSWFLTLFVFFGFLITFVDYRILKLFLMNVPFTEERIWVFRDFVLLPFVAFAISGIVKFISGKISSYTFPRAQLMRQKSRGVGGKLGAYRHRLKVPASATRKLGLKRFIQSFAPRFLGLALNALVLILLAGWTVASIFSAYPQYGPLQTTTYELEAAKHLKTMTNESYVVIGDQWAIFAGQMFVGVYNPRAFYFSIVDLRGSALFIDMKRNPSVEVMIEAMTYNNASVAYFIVEEPRLGVEEFNRVVSQALENGLEVYEVFGEGKLYVFRYRNGTGA